MTKGTDIYRNGLDSEVVTYERFGVGDNWHYDTIEEAVTADTDEQMDASYFAITCNECGEELPTVMNIRDIANKSNSLSTLLYEHNMTHWVAPRIYNCAPVDAGEDDGKIVEAWTHEGCTHGYMPNGDVLD